MQSDDHHDTMTAAEAADLHTGNLQHAELLISDMEPGEAGKIIIRSMWASWRNAQRFMSTPTA